MELETVIDLTPESNVSETAFEDSYDSFEGSGSSQDFTPVEESSPSEKATSSEESDMVESKQSEFEESTELESFSEDTQKGSSDTDAVTELPSGSGVSSFNSLDDKRTASPAVGSDSGFDFDPGVLGASDILDELDVLTFSEMDPEVISDWQGNIAACRSSLASCVSLLLFGDILLCLLLGCLCASIFSRFWKVNR